jgi:hypothetical protein
MLGARRRFMPIARSVPTPRVDRALPSLRFLLFMPLTRLMGTGVAAEPNMPVVIGGPAVLRLRVGLPVTLDPAMQGARRRFMPIATSVAAAP